MANGEVKIGHVVQFTEGHKWRGCFGFVEDVKNIDDGTRILVGVPVPPKEESELTDIVYIYSMLSNGDFEVVGNALLMPEEKSEG